MQQAGGPAMRRGTMAVIIALILTGVVLRVGVMMASKHHYLESGPEYGLHDIHAWVITGTMILEGRDPYVETYMLGFAPGWSWISAGVVAVAGKLGLGPWGAAVLIKLILIAADVVLILLVMKICMMLGKWPVIPVALLAINPVTVMTTGYQGQFDNITLIFVALMTILFLKWKQAGGPAVKDRRRSLISGALIGLSTTLKHASGPVFLFLYREFRNWKLWISAVLVALFIFLLSFVPHLSSAGPAEIAHDVFQHERTVGTIWYHITSLLSTGQIHRLLQQLIWLSILAFTAFVVNRKRMPIINAITIYYITIVLFMPNFARHYLVYPLVFGAIAYPLAAGIYSMVVTFFLFTMLRGSGPLMVAELNTPTWILFFALFCWWCLAIMGRNAAGQVTDHGDGPSPPEGTSLLP